MENTTTGSPKYWLSLEQWRDDAEFQKLADQEFASSPLSSDDGEKGWARREFLKLMGASMALSSFGCIRRPAQKIIPYAKRPPDVTPGIPDYYASCFCDINEGIGTVLNTREGRPINVKGNTLYPMNEGGMSARAHANILCLYDPDRLNWPIQNLLNKSKTNRDTIRVSFPEADKAIAKKLLAGQVAVLTSSLASPSTKALLSEFQQGFAAKHYIWDPYSFEEIREGQKLSYGQDVMPRLRLDRAKYILTVDADFLGTYVSPVEFNHQFSKARQPGNGMAKLVSFESMMTLTGSNADERYIIKPSLQLDVVMGLLHEIVVRKNRSRYATDASVKEILSPYANAPERLSITPAVFAEIADDLWANREQSLVLAGGLQGQSEHAVALQVAANFLNTVLSNDGTTIDYKHSVYTGYRGTTKGLQQLIADMKAGHIKTLIIHGVNPAYSTPLKAEFKKACDKVGLIVYTGDRNDETGCEANYVLPDHHSMEGWGDAEYQEGVFSVQQPTIQPLGETRSFQDTLIAFSKAAGRGSLSKATTYYDYLRNYWKTHIYNKHRQGIATKGFEDYWVALLQAGAFDTKGAAREAKSQPRGFHVNALKMASRKAKPSAGYELVLYQTVGLRDGSMANVPWLQEFPDPVTKICWDNYLSVSLGTAKKYNLQENDVVKLTSNGHTVVLPVHLQPGQHNDVLAVAVGYGRTAAGKVANGVGSDVYPMAKVGDGRVIFSGLDGHFEKTGGYDIMANTEGHYRMPWGNYLDDPKVSNRQIVVEETLAQFKKKPGSTIHREKLFTLWSKHEYPGHKWGMVINLSQCTGCSACLIACQSENNIPTVGKKYVIQGREMHWIRIDRYYKGDPASPDTVHMPVTCHHCDNAPCETVCPVLATVHGAEGTNDMIYNRCVGTRYCSNNCPYKVRRFNWFNFIKTVRAPQELALNPEVTVRSRGVMEKCTFCIHRIRMGEMDAKVKGKEIKDGDIKTACQESCPTHAIVWGDLNDESSEVRKQFTAPRAYTLLEQLNTRPALHYLTKVRNTDHLKWRGKKMYQENQEEGKNGRESATYEEQHS